MTKESIYELQKIDCNCNNCGYLKRDFDKFKKYENWNKEIQLSVFEKKKAHAFKIAEQCENEEGKKSLLHIAKKMRFIFNREGLINYGNCNKLNKEISFIPDICQPENLKCFVHRKELIH